MSYALFIDISCFMWHGKDKNKKIRKNMCKSEIFAKIINIVSKETEVSVAVNYMISNFHERMESGKMMRIYWDDIKNLLVNN